MRDETYERELQQRAVLFSTTPTQTASTIQTIEYRLEPPVITVVAKEPELPTFVLGTDTCGFTIGSTITCDFGNYCVNIDSYRGCCAADIEDCGATVFTECLDYDEMPGAATCGLQTLCCSLPEAYCATYEFTTEEQPGATFTHLRCAESPGFGELYAYPPEQGTETEGSSIGKTSSALAIDPTGSTHSSPSHSVSSGAIAGAVVGGIIFLLLAILCTSKFVSRRRRQRKENTGPGGGDNNRAPISSAENSGFDNRVPAGRLSSSFIVHEQKTHSPLPTSSRDRRRSVSSMLRRQSFGSNWPLGPVNPKNPLSSHPVVNTERRLSLSDPLPQPSYNQHTKRSMPIADVVFKKELEKTRNIGGKPSTNTLEKLETSSSVAPLLTAAASSPEVAGTAVATNKRLIEYGLYINTKHRNPSPSHEPVSPLSLPYQYNDTRQDQLLSSMPAQSTPHHRSREEVRDLVSPISFDGAEGRVSPVTVSPLESRRGSGCVL